MREGTCLRHIKMARLNITGGLQFGGPGGGGLVYVVTVQVRLDLIVTGILVRCTSNDMLPLFAMNSFAVYTAIAGGYDPLREHPYVPGVDWVAFSDRVLDFARTDWDVLPMVWFVNAHPRTRAKWYKVRSCMDIGKYDRTLWIDGSIELHSDALIRAALERDEPMTLYQHPDRDCIYNEAHLAKNMPKYKDQDLEAQVRHYKSNGHPKQWGLWASGIIARQRCALTMRIEERWWEEILKWSYQDQLSLPYVFRELDFKPGTFDGNMWESPWFTAHTQPEAL
jgi:hypothetical protein